MTDLFVGNDMEVQVTDLQDQDGNAVTGATVDVTVYDDRGSEVSGQSWPVTLSDDGGGAYSGIIDSGAAIEASKTYEIEIIATKGSTKATWRELRQAKRRTF